MSSVWVVEKSNSVIVSSLAVVRVHSKDQTGQIESPKPARQQLCIFHYGNSVSLVSCCKTCRSQLVSEPAGPIQAFFTLNMGIRSPAIQSQCPLMAISGHFCKAAGYDMLSADNMVCRSNGSNYETVIVSLDHNSIWD